MTQVAQGTILHPDQCGGRPCIRGMRIRDDDDLDLQANGLSAREVLEEHPDLIGKEVVVLAKEHGVPIPRFIAGPA